MMLRCHLYRAASSFFIWVTGTGHNSALYSTATSSSYNLVFTDKLILLLFHILDSFEKTADALPTRTRTSLSQFPVLDM